MRVHNLRLQNFRCFERLELDLDQPVIVLVGVNSVGKSTVLDALSALIGTWGGAMLDHFGVSADGEAKASGNVDAALLGTDVRRASDRQGRVVPAAEARVEVDVTLSAEPTWLGQILLPSGDVGGSEGLRAAFHESFDLVEQIRAGAPVTLPVHAAYSTRRGDVSSGRAFKVTTRADGYRGSMGARTDMRALREWLGEATAIELQEGRAMPERAAIERAVSECVPGAEQFQYLFRKRELTLTVGGIPLPLSLYSDGVRSMVALVADLAWRCAVLNSHLGEETALKTPGVVLIDEVDLHLHPEWQWRVLSDLRRAFPLIQFIVTTHSPQIIASAETASLRLLHRDGGTENIAFGGGWDSNSILREVMGVDIRPRAVAAQIAELESRIDRGEFEEARRELDQLRDRLGAEYSEVVHGEWALRAAEVERGSDGEVVP